MIPKAVQLVLESPNDETIDALLETEQLVWVDWRASPGDVVAELRESLTELAVLAAVAGPGPHQSIVQANAQLVPAHEIRLCKDSAGADTLAFLVLSGPDWRSLESRFGVAGVGERFYRVQASPDLYEDQLPF